MNKKPLWDHEYREYKLGKVHWDSLGKVVITLIPLRSRCSLCGDPKSMHKNVGGRNRVNTQKRQRLSK